ncbi:muscarinic Acetylcholine Receptor, C-type isoform X2 [Haematobia irritans]|uniref:muscarinic Acetylcholine Receptor, C-type isoform X2 n=1 Tax=Haematobia irritans TaxID=7368 RepID=UPI003F4FE12E
MDNYNKSYNADASYTETEFALYSNISTGIDLSWATISWAFVNGILFIAILAGNAFTIIAIRTCRRLRSLISNLFILSLAVSDFIVGLTLPYNMSFYLGSTMGNKHGLCMTRFFFIIFACCVSILTLISISVDRYIAIVYALHYRRYMTRKVAVIIIIFNWILGATVATIPMFWNNWNNAYECEFDEVLPPWYMAGMITPSFIVLWILMLLMYWRIVNEASKQASQMKKTMRKKTSPLIHPEWKSVQVVILIMGCFSLCWLPYFIVACAQLFEIYKISAMLYKISFSLAMANSALNPVIYSWKNSNFRQAFVQIIRCKSPNCYQKTSLDCLEKSSTCEKRSSNNVPRERFQIFPCSQLRLQTIYTVTDRMPAIQ